MTITACCCGCDVQPIACSTSAVIDTNGDGVSVHKNYSTMAYNKLQHICQRNSDSVYTSW
jgi:hypothetical protein